MAVGWPIQKSFFAHLAQPYLFGLPAYRALQDVPEPSPPSKPTPPQNVNGVATTGKIWRPFGKWPKIK